MAATQKKKPNTKAKTAPKRPSKPKYDPVARLVGGIVCLLLMLCVAVSYFNVEAVFLTFFAKMDVFEIDHAKIKMSSLGLRLVYFPSDSKKDSKN